MIKKILFILTIFFISFFTVGKSLQFALNGDDWLALWRFHITFPTLNSFFDLNNYYTNYDIANIIMGLIYYFFSYNPFYYYLISLVLRIFVIISLFFAVKASTKSKVAALLSSLFLSCMFTGIETTNWVFNMNTYLSLGLLNIFIYLFFKTENSRPVLKTFSFGILLAISYIIAPTRMHGLLFFIPTLIIINKSKNYSLSKILRNLLLFIIPILIAQNLFSAGNFKIYFDSILPAIKHPLSAINSLFANLGHILLPNKIIIFNHISPTPGYILLGFGYFVFTLVTIYIFRKTLPQLAKISLLFLLLPIFFLIVPVMINYPTSFSSEHRYLLIPGAYLLSSVAINLILFWRTRWARGIIILAIAYILFINLSTLSWYFDLLSKEGRLQTDRQKQFNTVKSLIKETPNENPLVFLVLYDDPLYAYNSLQFGFQYQMILTDNQFGLNAEKAPFIVDNLDSLIDVINNKESNELNRYGYKPVNIPIENVFILTLQNKSLVDTTLSYKPLILEKLSAKRGQKKNK